MEIKIRFSALLQCINNYLISSIKYLKYYYNIKVIEYYTVNYSTNKTNIFINEPIAKFCYSILLFFVNDKYLYPNLR